MAEIDPDGMDKALKAAIPDFDPENTLAHVYDDGTNRNIILLAQDYHALAASVGRCGNTLDTRCLGCTVLASRRNNEKKAGRE